MTKDQVKTQAPPQPPRPDSALKRLDVLIGAWDLRGRTLDPDEDNITGWNTFEWLPGGFCLKSTGEINFKGAIVQSLELIAMIHQRGLSLPTSILIWMGVSFNTLGMFRAIQ